TDVFPLADGLPLIESSVLGCAIFTAYGAVKHGAELARGQTVAVVATGGVGTAIVQLAKAFGAAKIIAVDVIDDQLQAPSSLGPTAVVTGSPTDAGARVRELTGGKGVDVAFEVLGLPQTFQQAVEMLA